MSDPDEYSVRRYLAAKRTVDDRALDRRVLSLFADELSAGTRILDVGAGVGTMVERLLAWNLLPRNVTYTMLDVDESVLAAARQRLRERGFESLDSDQSAMGPLVRDTLRVEFVAADAVSFTRATDHRWDAVVGCSFADLVALDDALPALRSVVEPGGVCYFPVTFDGRTAFAPARPLDDRVEQLYHRYLDAKEGSSQAGRRLLAALPDHGAAVLAAGGSDWVVHPRNGEYPGDEAYFLRHVLRFVERALADEDDEFDDWLAARRRQVAAGELRYVAGNLDVLARRE